MMQQRGSHRVEQVSDSIRREISRLLVYEIKDPKLKHVTVTNVRMTADLKEARIYYDWAGPAEERIDIERRLVSAAPFLRHSLAHALTFKFVPRLFFHFDETRSIVDRANQLLDEINESPSHDDK